MEQQRPPAQCTGQAQPDGRDERDRHDVGCDSTGVVGESHDLWPRGIRHGDDDEIAGDDDPVDPPARHGPRNAQDHHGADRRGDEQPEGEGVDLTPAHGLRLLSHGDERRLSDHGNSAEEEAERQEWHQRPLPGELGGQALAEWEDAEVEPLEEYGDPQGDDQHPDDEGGEVLGNLADHEELEGADDDHDRQEAGQGALQPDEEVLRVVAHAPSSRTGPCSVARRGI